MRNLHRAILVVIFAAAALRGQTGATAAAHPEATSLLGRGFQSQPDDKGLVAAAEKALAADPKNTKLFLKLAQAQATVWQEKEAVETCTRGLAIDPKNADLLTERGHRELPLRQFTRARDDLSRAIALDPKQTEAYYHLGLAHYFLGEFSPAADAFLKGRDLATNQDSLVNFTNWCYASLRRAGRKEEAAKALEKVPLDIKSNPGHTEIYFSLVRFYQGQKTESDILPPQPKDPADTEAELSYDTVNYQIGNWYLYNGDAAKATDYFRRVSKGNVWVTWGFIASETELAKRK
ncbi:MAG TPA: tetratricopeptide repeat protein [Bryobacteraceae bacterium]|nr:tetratricopeptide repeat protein [Bryobacteraceae bacterium]